MNTFKILTLIGVCSIGWFSILSCSDNNKDSFSNDLAHDLISTFNIGSGKKEAQITDVLTYSNPNKGIIATIGGADPTEIPFIKDGLSDGFHQRGMIQLSAYNSVFGQFSNQQLHLNRTAHIVPNTTNWIDYLFFHIWGVIVNDSGDPIKVNYAFRCDNSSDLNPFDLNTIKLVDGQIQEGHDLYDVQLHTHTKIQASVKTSSTHTSRSWLGRIWDSLTGGVSISETVEVNSSSNITPIKLLAGDHLSLQANGQIKLGMFAGTGGPDGIDDGYESYSKIPSFKHGALIGRIGYGEWFLVGSEHELDVQTEGTLYLVVNDTDLGNNQGSYTVQCQIKR
ncbi:hypothetical protein [Spirosoma pollinicola]|uniref:Lipoprotein n=1 Tax=Spirosoma pollinicola TaxID=2057025 RepID=A0A2K8YX71_9BACT|nr:hypothetical protein [Spirosoma pollinicola]AUD02174.1 hypothetical protein CWM47_10285 [Spirosoma pollinicola]